MGRGKWRSPTAPRLRRDGSPRGWLAAELCDLVFQLASQPLQVAAQAHVSASPPEPARPRRQGRRRVDAKRARRNRLRIRRFSEPGLEPVPFGQTFRRRRVEQQARTIRIEINHVLNYRRIMQGKRNVTLKTAHFPAQSIQKTTVAVTFRPQPEASA